MAAIDIATPLVAHFEGFCQKPTLCPAGVPTIGYGTTWYPWGAKVKMDDPACTEQQAQVWLAYVLKDAEKSVDACVDDGVALNDNQKAALMSFVYNLGARAFHTSTLLRKLNSGDCAGAAREFGRWIYGGGRVLPGLVKRREAERQLFEKVA